MHTSWNKKLLLGLWQDKVRLGRGEDDLHLRTVTHFAS